MTLNRRHFLKGATGLAFGLGLISRTERRPVLAGAGSRSEGLVRWRELEGELEGTLLRPGDPDFARIARPWNLRFASILPAGIARCATASDIRRCILWAQTNGIPLVARSGGHSYAGYSTTTGLMIDLSPMNDVSYDAGSGVAQLGAGTRNADVYANLRTVGRAITHGRCAAVGVAGLVLGGGIGFSQRLRGLTCDQLIATDVLTASGDLLHCSEQENAGLFWACRGGGGGNFGINTTFTFQTHPVDMVTAYDIRWTANLDALLPAAFELFPSTTDRLGCKLSVVNNGTSLSLQVLGHLTGTMSELRSILAPLYRLASPDSETVSYLPYWDGQDFLSEEGTPEYAHERSLFIYRPLPADAAAMILEYLRAWPGTSAAAVWKFFLAGGATAEMPSDATAFVHRGAQLLSSIELDWSPDDSVGAVARNEDWLTGFHEAMGAYASGESYQNFIDEAQTDFLHAYYGANLERLIQIKRLYDPDNVFSYPQGIPLSLPQGLSVGEGLVPSRPSEQRLRAA